MSKPELEFTPAEQVSGWTRLPGDAEGLSERVLARHGRDGVVTRILRFEPGADSSPNGAQLHDFWEEIYILEGSITDVTLGETFAAGSYACRPPGMRHGPWRSDDGALLFEVRYPERAEE
jgi:ChrR Cupin-like domain